MPRSPRPGAVSGLALLLDALPLPAFVIDDGGRVTAGNGRYEALAGAHHDEFMALARTNPHAATAEGWFGDFYLELRRSPAPGGGTLTVVVDVTEHLLAEQDLAEAVARAEHLAEFSREGLMIHAGGVVVDCNHSLCEMTGWERDELIGQSFLAVIDPSSADEAMRRVRERSDAPYRLVLRRRDGGTLPAEARGQTHVHHGEEMRAVAIRDISREVEAERALGERETLYRQMFETNRAVKLLIDPETGEIVDANHAAELFYGWPLETLRTMRITDINVLAPGEVLEEMQRAKAEARLYFRFPHRVASGEVRSVEVYSGPVLHQGRVLLHSIIHDVTDRERYQRELERKTAALEQSNADLEQFAYVASHDLQEPLRTVVSYLQLIERRYRDRLDAEADEFITYAVEGAKRMSRLIRDLLAYSRIETAGGQMGPVDCAGAAANALVNLRQAIDDAGAVVEIGPLPVVTGDASQLTSLFQNLIGNAIKYRHPDRPPHVRIAAERGDGEWLVSVADDGPGIAPEYHERIFMIFQRLQAGGHAEGTGIGLALAKRIVSRHGGRIWVESGEGEGATFRFTLRPAD
ncbi:MAG: PAS domain S-box protein [Pseudomonadota bacterium]